MPLIEPDILYAEGIELPLPLGVSAPAGPRGAKGATGDQGQRGPRGATGPAGPTEFSGSTSHTFMAGQEYFFGPDGTVFTTVNDVVPGRIVATERTLTSLTAKCNTVPVGCQVLVTVYQSTDDGATWQSVGNANVTAGLRTVTATVNVTLEAQSLHCASVAVDGFDYDGPVSWALHN